MSEANQKKIHCRIIEVPEGTVRETDYSFAKEALETGRSVYDLVLEHGILTKEDLDTILSPENMIKPVKLDIKPMK